MRLVNLMVVAANMVQQSDVPTYLHVEVILTLPRRNFTTLQLQGMSKTELEGDVEVRIKGYGPGELPLVRLRHEFPHMESRVVRQLQLRLNAAWGKESKSWGQKNKYERSQFVYRLYRELDSCMRLPPEHCNMEEYLMAGGSEAQNDKKKSAHHCSTAGEIPSRKEDEGPDGRMTLVDMMVGAVDMMKHAKAPVDFPLEFVLSLCRGNFTRVQLLGMSGTELEGNVDLRILRSCPDGLLHAQLRHDHPQMKSRVLCQLDLILEAFLQKKTETFS